MKYYMKVHTYQDERLVAICDKKILGMKLNHNDVVLHVHERFYGELICDLDEVLRELKACTSLNVMGKSICDELIDRGMINPLTVLWIDSNIGPVGHAIVVL